jgi:hypothetical protein
MKIWKYENGNGIRIGLVKIKIHFSNPEASGPHSSNFHMLMAPVNNKMSRMMPAIILYQPNTLKP